MSGENTKVYMKQGGDELVVANGGKITVESGGEIVVEDGAQIDDGIKVYRANLTINGGVFDVITVLKNTLGGDPVWSKSSVGQYDCTLVNAFPATKVFALATLNFANRIDSESIVGIGRNSDDNTVTMIVLDDSFINHDYFIGSVEILVYP